MTTVFQSPSQESTCLCCGASAPTPKEIQHDELCSYNNTKQAFLEFLPEDFILGVQNNKTSNLRKYCEDLIDTETADKINRVVDVITEGADGERAKQCVALWSDPLFCLSLSEANLIYKLSAKYKVVFKSILHNFLLFKAADSIAKRNIKDEHFRRIARKEVLSQAFTESFNVLLG